jgi:hypothetical protein
MVGHRDRQSFVLRVHRNAFRHRPRLQNAADFEPQIKMQARGVVFVNDKAFSHILRKKIGRG